MEDNHPEVGSANTHSTTGCLQCKQRSDGGLTATQENLLISLRSHGVSFDSLINTDLNLFL